MTIYIHLQTKYKESDGEKRCKSSVLKLKLTIMLLNYGELNPGPGPIFLHILKVKHIVIAQIMLYTYQKMSLKKLKLKE